MKSLWAFLVGFLLIGTATVMAQSTALSYSEGEFAPFALDAQDIPSGPSSNFWSELGFRDYSDWQRPNVPPRVGLQVGHLKNEELPEELESLIGNTGATGGGKSEAEVAYQIALEAKDLLEANGIVVDILPATVPPEYWADAFVSIHADGSTDRYKSGYKVAAPWRDLTGRAERLSDLMEETYGDATGLVLDDANITVNMRGYYAFNWRRYEHSIHPMTPAVILETGFLTSPKDQQLLIKKPHIVAQGLVDGVLLFLDEQNI